MENLKTEKFKEKIFNFIDNAEWNFIGNKPVIIDFYTDWCSPCKRIAPILEELSTEYSSIDFYKVNAENENELATFFHIKSVPSILFIPLTGTPLMIVGGVPKGILKENIKDIFNID
jgi:thioredoxin 1